MGLQAFNVLNIILNLLIGSIQFFKNSESKYAVQKNRWQLFFFLSYFHFDCLGNLSIGEN